MNDDDAKDLLNKIISIMQEAESDLVQGSSSKMFTIYKLARDARDLLTFDAVSRDILRKLGVSDIEYMGTTVKSTVLDLIKSGQKILAIKELRSYSGLGLDDARDIVERISDKYNTSPSQF
jgi:hypothetical protein